MAPADLAAPPFDVAAFAADIGVSPDRVVRAPRPGTATEDVLLRVNAARRGPLCELIDGTLVEKPTGFPQADFGGYLLVPIHLFVRRSRHGWVAATAPMRMANRRVRLPSFAFLARETAPGGRRITTQIAGVAPDLAVELLSPSNTRREMLEKRRDYFGSGTQLVWEVDVARRTVAVYTAPDAATVLTAAAGDTLTGGDVQPGLSLSLADLFAEYDADA